MLLSVFSGPKHRFYSVLIFPQLMYQDITVPEEQDGNHGPQIHLASKSDADIRCLFKSI